MKTIRITRPDGILVLTQKGPVTYTAMLNGQPYHIGERIVAMMEKRAKANIGYDDFS